MMQTSAHAGSWHTIKKYLEELASEGLVIRQSLPTDSKHKSLVLYVIRGCRADLRKIPVQDS